MDVSTAIAVLEVDGHRDSNVRPQGEMTVESAWNWKRERVVLNVGGHKYLVIADELKRAIENATNFGMLG